MPDTAPSPFALAATARDQTAIASLAANPDPSARLGVAWNPSTPADILRTLTFDSHSAVRLQSTLNPALPDEDRQRMAPELQGLLTEVLELPGLDPAAAAALTRAVEAIAGGDG